MTSPADRFAFGQSFFGIVQRDDCGKREEWKLEIIFFICVWKVSTWWFSGLFFLVLASDYLLEWIETIPKTS